VDFSGYNPFWGHVLLQAEARTHSIFLHNDLLADSQREINGKRPHEKNLRSIFATYRQFDNLISVSSALAEINREKLTAFAPAERFVSAVNTVNCEAILKQAYGLTDTSATFLAPEAAELRAHPEDWAGERGTTMLTLDIGNLPGAVETLARQHSLEAVLDEVNRCSTIHQLLPPVPGVVTFVTAGRLSPEKNHARLIRAFDLVHQEHPNTRLMIMGSGALLEDLQSLIVELGLVTAVTLAGHQDNPYGVMANSDCFVLSSEYEGQPMVILEAMSLGLPVITTDFASVRGAVPEGHGLVVPMSVDGLADGMIRYLNGEIKPKTFDYDTYNQQAIRQFYDAIGSLEGESARPVVAVGSPRRGVGLGEDETVGLGQNAGKQHIGVVGVDLG
jgi:glycosyltransferase involved in cell wall biosynthesis